MLDSKLQEEKNLLEDLYTEDTQKLQRELVLAKTASNSIKRKVCFLLSFLFDFYNFYLGRFGCNASGGTLFFSFLLFFLSSRVS